MNGPSPDEWQVILGENIIILDGVHVMDCGGRNKVLIRNSFGVHISIMSGNGSRESWESFYSSCFVVEIL